MTEGLEVAALDGSAKRVSAAELSAFRASFRGPILRTEDAGYEDVRAIWNAMIERRPALIARCTGTADVVAAVRFARAHGLLSSVRGGGHNIAGMSVCEDGVMIDLSLMRGVLVDPRASIVRAQAGCILADVDRETQLHGQAAVLGFISQTGIAGLTTGGGFGWLTRRAGWTCDTVTSMEVVTASGEVVRASETENPELLWCLRGGSGNFGIVTAFEHRTFPVGPEIVGGLIAWRADDAREVLAFYREHSVNAPRELTCTMVLRRAPPAPWLPKEIHGEPVAIMVVCHSGRPEDGEKLVAPIKKLGKPVADIVVRRPYAQMQMLLDGTQPKGRRYYWKSEYLARLDPGVLDAYVTRLATIPSPHSGMILFQIGGALSELPADHSPAGNRGAAYVANLASSWERAEDDAKNIAWTRESWETIRPFSSGAYLNFMAEDEGKDRIQYAFGASTLTKLAALKRKYDPDNFFRHTKSVLG
jgi:FAD/FMN-containing dehydrogenase